MTEYVLNMILIGQVPSPHACLPKLLKIVPATSIQHLATKNRICTPRPTKCEGPNVFPIFTGPTLFIKRHSRTLA